MVEVEKRGVPTVSFTAEGFVKDARRSASAFGLPALPLAVVPLPFTNQSPEVIRRMVASALEQVVAGLTMPPAPPPDLPGPRPAEEESLVFEGSDLLDCADRMNRFFLERGWGDGFPLVPPTRGKVEWLLTGTRRRPNETVAVLEPGFGVATVEKIAINAVMAGCRPEHLPILLTAVKCLADPRIYLRNKAMSTGPHAPLVLVNGPIARKVGLNSGVCALGPGAPSYANTVIGRALRLVMMNIGHTYPGVSDMDTIGSPTKYSLCVAENESASPWPPYSVEKGFPPDASTVTVHFVYGICELFDFQSRDPEGLCRVFATAVTNVAQVSTGHWLLGRRGDPRYGVTEKEHNFLFLCPEHADIFARHGWDRARIRRELYRLARVPFGLLMQNKEPEAMRASHPELEWLWDHPDLPLPVVEDPDCFEIAVVGGSAGRGAYFYGAGAPVTLAVEE